MIKQIYRSLCIASVSLLLLGLGTAFGQSRVVTGKITDETGQALPGVNVIKKGTTTGTSTDGNGAFAIEAANDDVLVASFIGYAPKEFTVGNQTTIAVTLAEDVSTLDEVVVVGYGEQKKSDLTGSMVSLNEKQLKGTVITSIDQALQGRAAGVQVTQNSGAPGGGVSIRIRGSNSLTGSSEPLYVVDGIPFQGDGVAIKGFDWAGGSNGQNSVNALSSINPNDIVNIEILKDASATAIYGSRAANGVVLITTRRGKKGESKISYDGYYSIQSPLKKLKMMDLPQYADYQNQIGKDLNQKVDEKFADPSLLGKGTNWQNEVFKSAPMQSHNLSITGGTDKTTYSISGGYLNQDGTIIGSNFKRFSTRTNIESQVKDWFKTGIVLSFTRTDQKITSSDGLDGVVSQALLATPDVAVRNIDGTYSGPINTYSGASTNPVALALLRNNTLNLNRFMTNIYGQADLVKGLNFRSEIGLDYNESTNKAFFPTYQWGASQNNQSQMFQAGNNSFFWIWKNYLTYQLTSGIHSLTVLAGTEAQKSTYEGYNVVKKNFASNDIQVLSQGDIPIVGGNKGAASLNSYYGRFNYSLNDRYLLTLTMRADGSSKFGPNNRWGYFPSAALAWRISNEEFLKSIPAISNMKLRLGYGAVGNQAVPDYLYGASLIAQTAAFGTTYRSARNSNPNLKWESTTQYNLGLDLAVLNGRIDLSVDVYQKYITNLILQQLLPGSLGGSTYTDIQAPWANTGKMENKGFDITVSTQNIVNSKLTWNTNFTFSLNRNKVTYVDRPYTTPLDYYSEFKTPTRTYVGLPIGSFYGYVTEGIFKNQQEILDHAVQVQDQSTDTPVNLVSKRDGVWIGDVKFKDISGPDGKPDGKIDTYDQTIIGNPNPKFTFGFNNTFTYGPFDLTVFLTGSYGGKILNFSRSQIEGMTNLYANQSATVVNRSRYAYAATDYTNYDIDPANVTLANPGTSLPRFTTNDINRNNRMSDRFIEDGSYLRLQNISLGYTLPASITQKFRVQRLKVYVNAQKLYTWTNYSGYDPEIGAYNQNALLQNVDRGRYPSPKTFTFGVNLDF